jgi:hypothetical protein
MDFIPAYLKRGLPLAVLAWAGVFSVPVQGAEPLQGQPILFSSPARDDAETTNLPSLTLKLPGELDFKDITRAPENFNLTPQGEGAPLPRGPGFSGETAQQQDRRRNWMLLTPAEILGAATPEKIMGISERNAFGQPKNSTALERYTERQNLLQLKLSRTNALLSGDSSSAWNPSGNSYGMSNAPGSGWRNPAVRDSPLFNSSLDRQPPDRPEANSTWSRLFGQPAAIPVPNLAQQADLDRFRQLLNPGSSSLAPMANSSSDGIKTSLPQTMLGSGLDGSSPPRFGVSFTPLSSGISKPPDLPKLPRAWNVGYTSAPPAATWSPQQAPWLTPGPQPFVAPQRKF